MIDLDLNRLTTAVDFAPDSTEAEVVQNVRTILATRKGSVPLDREFGLDWSFLDRPVPVAQAMLSTQVIQQLRRYEPRARVLRVLLEADDNPNTGDGQTRPRVQFEVVT